MGREIVILGFRSLKLFLFLISFLVPFANAEPSANVDDDLQGMQDAVSVCRIIPKSRCAESAPVFVELDKQADGYAIVEIYHKGDKKENYVPALLKKINGHWVELDEGSGIDWSQWEPELPQALK